MPGSVSEGKPPHSNGGFFITRFSDPSALRLSNRIEDGHALDVAGMREHIDG